MARISPQVVAKIARAYGVDPRIFVNQIRQESGFNTSAHSSAGAQGIAQIVYRWHPDAPPPSDPIGQLKYAAQMMRGLVNKYGNYKDALSVYNSGRPFSSGRNISETRNYVSRIMGGSNPASFAGNGANGTGGNMGGNRGVPGGTSRDSLMKWLMSNNTNFMKTGHITSASPPSDAPSPAGADSYNPVDSGGPVMPLEQGGNKLANAAKLASQLGLKVTEYAPYGPVHHVHVPNSMHYSGRAFDASGSPQAMSRLFQMLSRTSPTELFYDPSGAIKNGRRIAPIGGHGTHIHVGY